MKIGIDGRLWGVGHTGIGRYTEELVRNLQRIDNKNEYVVFCWKQDVEKIPPQKKWATVISDIPHYSFREQISLPGIFRKENLDLLHVPHFNVPLFYNRPFIVTIHDILWHRLQGLSVSTLPAPLYFIKHLGYRAVLNNAIERSKKIIVPSNSVKDELVKYFKIPPSKVIAVYEGVAKLTFSSLHSDEIFQKYKIESPYLLYVGNLYPHKNVDALVGALKHSNTSKYRSELSLVVVCGRSVFWERFREFVKSNGAERFVKLIGHVSDEELAGLYKNAEAFVFPTLSEGFGLPGLEAMAAGTPVVCSDIPVLHEVYGSAALYFNPKNPQDIADKIQEVLSDDKLKDRLIEAGKSQAAKFSWRKTAEETLGVYRSALESR